MRKSWRTYLFLPMLLTGFAADVRAGVTDPIANAIDMAKQGIEQVGTAQENLTSQFQGYMNTKIGQIGDVNALQKTARKAEKAKQRLEKMQQKAAHAREEIARLQERAQKIQQQVDEAKAKANQIIADAEAAREEIINAKNKVEEKAEEAKQTVSEVKDAASALKDQASSQVAGIQDKAESLSPTFRTPLPTASSNQSTVAAADRIAAVSQASAQTAPIEAVTGIPDVTWPGADISAAEVWENSSKESVSTMPQPVLSTDLSIEEQLTGTVSSQENSGETAGANMKLKASGIRIQPQASRPEFQNMTINAASGGQNE